MNTNRFSRRLLGALALLATCALAFAYQDDLPRGGSLGAVLTAVPADVQTKDHLQAGEGLLVSRLIPNLTGEKAGLKAGDVVLTVNGKKPASATIIDLVKSIPVGQQVTFDIVRDGTRMTVGAPMVMKPKDHGNEFYDVIYSHVVSNGNRMRTIITRPKSPGKHPAVMFIQGFSPISYDFDLTGQGLDAPLLYDFAKNGYVLMRVEKPGVGDSEGGPFAALDFTTELDIYRQATKQLKGLDYVDPDKVIMLGHSMGGAFGPIIANETPFKGIIMYGIAARTWHEYLIDISRYQALLAGASYASVDDTVRKTARAFGLVLEENISPDDAKKAHPELAATINDNFPGGLFQGKALSFWRQLETTNFADYWAKCNSRVLSIHGQSDFVTYDVDHKLVADIVNAIHPGWGTFYVAPSSDHLFNNWPTEADSLKNFGRGSFNPAILDKIHSWLQEVMKS